MICTFSSQRYFYGERNKDEYYSSLWSVKNDNLSIRRSILSSFSAEIPDLNRKNVIMITRKIKYLCFWVFADIFADSASAFIFIWSATCALVSLHPFNHDNLMLDYMPYYGNWPSIDCQNQIIVTVRLTYSCLVIRRVFKTRHRSKLMNKWCIFGIFTLEIWTRRSKIENWCNHRPKLPVVVPNLKFNLETYLRKTIHFESWFLAWKHQSTWNYDN